MQIASTTTQKQKKLEEQHSQMLCNDLETPSSKTRNKKSNFQSPISPIMEEIYGVDITTLSGIDQATALKIMAELGGTVEAWRTAKHFPLGWAYALEIRFRVATSLVVKRNVVSIRQQTF